MTEDTKVQDKKQEGKPESELHAEPKPAEKPQAEEMKDRTREQFDKLKESNKSLQEKLRKYEEAEKKQSVLDSLRQPMETVNPTSSNVEAAAPTLVDQEGYVNATLLQQRLTDAETRAREAERKAQEASQRFERYEETKQIQDAHAKYPQLDPHSDKFDQTFYDLTLKELIVQKVNGEKDVVKAADTISKFYRGVEPIEAAQEDKKAEADEAKQNINAGMSRSASAAPYADLSDDDLRKKVQRGDRKALQERMSRAGY